MKHQKRIFLLLLFSPLILLAGLNEEIDSLIHETYGSECKIELSSISLTAGIIKRIEQECKQKFYRDQLNCYTITTESGDTLTALLDNVYGKSLPITFMVVFDKRGNIDNSFIIKYRETHGYGVKSNEWLKQFTGKNEKSGFTPGTDIQGVTGSTISVRSVSTGIKKLTLVYNIIHKK